MGLRVSIQLIAKGLQHLLLLLLLLLLVSDTEGAPQEQLSLEPVNLRIDRHRLSGASLVVIDSERPILTWELRCQGGSTTDCRGIAQRTFNVIAVANGSVLYDSGVIESTTMQHVLLLGGVGSDVQITVAVRACTAGPVSCTLARGQFQTGLLHDSDWQDAAWLGGFTALRGEFELPVKRIDRATVFASGVGCFALTVNGVPASPTTYMEPGWNFIPTVRMLYRAFDVTSLLSNASNAVGVRLGMCKFGYQDSFCQGAHGSLPTCRAFRMRLLVHYSDGSQVIVTTRGSPLPSVSWFGTTTDNPLRYTHLYHGEIWDNNVGSYHWDTPAFVRTTAWQPAVVYPAAGQLSETMSLHQLPPIRVTQTFAPESITTVGASFVFDFGRNMAGFCTMVVTASAGNVVTLKYGEVLNADGTVNMAYGSGAGINQANQTDQVVLAGLANETFTPLFTYHGFRYVQVEGLEAAPRLKAHFVHTALEKRGNVRFNSSYEILNRIQTAIEYTQLSNIHSHPEDCPQREKRGWTGDAQLTSGEASLNFDTSAMYATWLQAMRDSQNVGCTLHSQAPEFPQANTFLCCDPEHPSFGCNFDGIPEAAAGFNDTYGSIADVVPYMHVGGWPGDPSWGVAGVTIPWEVMVKGGEHRIADDHYETSKAVVDFLSKQGNPEAGGLVTFGYYGDWLSLETTPNPQVTGWSHLLGMSRLVDIANASGRIRDAIAYSEKLAALKAQYHKQYFNEKTGNYGATQTANLLPLYLDIPPSDVRASVAKAFLDNLNAHGNLTTSGIVGAAFLLQVLTQLGEHELALKIASATTKPSWGYMVEQGPGTIWETWTDITNSHNHPALSATIGPYLYSLAGLSTSLGGRYRLAVHPSVAFRLGASSVSLRTHAGQLSYQWQADDVTRSFVARIVVPYGLQAVEAHLVMPAGKRASALRLQEFHSKFEVALSALAGAKLPVGISKLTLGHEVLVLELTSGAYDFRLSEDVTHDGVAFI